MPVSQSSMNSKRFSKREVFGWAMYDFANSSYTTVVITFIYSAFFIAHIVPEELSHMRNSLWAAAITISTLISIFAAPFVGVICDLNGNKKAYLAVCTLGSVIGTACLYFVGPGNIALGLIFLVISNTAWMLSESFNASLLTDISNKQNIGRISGIGWGVGYIGGLLSLIIVSLIIKSSPHDSYAAYINENQMAMLFIALFYLLASLPLFAFVKTRKPENSEFSQLRATELAKLAFQRLIQFRVLTRQYPVLFHFFMAFLVYSAGISVVIKFLGIYASEDVGITGTELIYVGATLQISSMVGAIGFGFLEDKIGSKPAILYSLALWIGGIIGIYFLDKISLLLGTSLTTSFLIIAFIAGSALGATQSCSRALVGRLTSPEDSSLMFGLWGTFARLSIILAMAFGPLSDLVGRKNGLLLILVYFVLGGVMLMRVPVNKTDQSVRLN
ncbi:MFS transporter [Reinekea marinisedimentorum]|uniref:UMF1 family MFS transporter n=1 Tax=Reinekea marinisedimentorum TaxID=230495 RepID=A0A4R3IAD9_9GAMM|nr:MFS transporter [Reinekea marinisedimentorum]TCS42467.1 UMF1 family MFS transporter [Reinekea marinisedimentorum]